MSETAAVNLTSIERDHRPFGNHQALVNLQDVSHRSYSTIKETD